MAETAETQLDETRLARLFALVLPAVTIGAAIVVGVMIGPATAILVLAAGTLLGVIALFWSSLRVLSGDAPLPAELEELDLHAGGDTLEARRTMLLRALKDVENEKRLGKIEQEDYDQIVATYREELKVVLRRIDEVLAPHRAKAEALVEAHLAGAGGGSRAPGTAKTAKVAAAETTATSATAAPEGTEPAAEGLARVACPSCGASNEKDAKFCKECATGLAKPAAAEKTEDANAV